MDSLSPTGRYRVTTHSEEVRAAQWVDIPKIWDTVTDEVIADLDGDRARGGGLWSLDRVRWTGNAQAVLTLRRFPGVRPHVEAIVDCGGGAAMVRGRRYPLRDLLAALEA